MVPINQSRSFRSSRVEQHDLAASFSNRLDAVFDIRGRHQATVRGCRVGPEYQHELSAVNIRNGDQQTVPKHLAGRKMMRQLIDRSRSKTILGPNCVLDELLKHQSAIVVDRGVAEVDRDGVVTELITDGAELLFNEGERCLLYTSPSPRDATLSRMPSSA